MDIIERKIQVSNIIYAHQLGIITFEEAANRMKCLVDDKNYIEIKPLDLN